MQRASAHGEPLFESLDRALVRPGGALRRIPLLPPRRNSVFQIKSIYLGVWAYTILVPRNYYSLKGTDRRASEALQKLLEDINKILQIYFKAKKKPYPFEGCFFDSSPIPKTSRGEEWYQVPATDSGWPEWWKGERNEKSLSDSDIDISRNALGELPSLSWPWPQQYRSKSAHRVKYSYYHYKEPGKGVVVYVLDSGVDPDTPDLEDANFQDWILGGLFPSEERTDINFSSDMLSPHGTAVAGKIAGERTGIAQKAEIMAASCADGHGQLQTSTVLDCFLKTYDHVRKHNSNKPCVINFSIYLPSQKARDALYIDIMNEFNKLKNVVFVQSAGNGRPPPVAIAASDPRLTRFIVAGAATQQDHNAFQFNNSFVNMVWGPGTSISAIAFPDPRIPEHLISNYMDYRLVVGTSYASPTRVDDAISKLKELSHVRIRKDRNGKPLDPKQVPVAWNGISDTSWPLEDRKAARENIPAKIRTELEVKT
ncbi:Secreted subtilisin-like serine protease sub4 [Arthrobotrys megalospora]